jgi:RNA polymerase sigma-70 factor (ECF subfamily)
MVQLVERFQGQVFGLCYRMLGQRQDAEDAAQETFVRVLRSLARWDSSRDFEPWLLAIAANRCRTVLASRQRRPGFGPLDDEQYVDRSPDLQAARDLAEEVRRALGGIREDYRAAFLLFHDHELSYDEIAEALQRPLGTIKTWIRRARQELVAQLQRREVIPEPRDELRKV